MVFIILLASYLRAFFCVHTKHFHYIKTKGTLSPKFSSVKPIAIALASAASARVAWEVSFPNPCLERVSQAMGLEVTSSLGGPAKMPEKGGGREDSGQPWPCLDQQGRRDSFAPQLI